MPANKYYSQFNSAVKLYINQSNDFEDIESILDIVDIDLLNRIIISIQSRFAYVKHDDKKIEEVLNTLKKNPNHLVIFLHILEIL